MTRLTAATVLAAVMALAALPAAAQTNSLTDRSLPGTTQTDRSLPDRRLPGLGNRAPDRTNGGVNRELPQLRDRSDVDSAPAGLRDRFADYCRARGCPGGYEQHRDDFTLYEADRMFEERQRRELELQQNNGTTMRDD